MMNRIRLGRVASLAVLAAATSAPPVGAGPVEVSVIDARAQQPVALEDVTMLEDGVVAGRIVNRSDAIVRDPCVLIDFRWEWRNEFKPGEDNPSRAELYTLAQEIPPGGSALFTYRPSPPLPARADGSFTVSATITRFTQVD